MCVCVVVVVVVCLFVCCCFFLFFLLFFFFLGGGGCRHGFISICNGKINITICSALQSRTSIFTKHILIIR